MLLSFAFPSLTHIGLIVLLVVGFGFVIFWHELGHFLAAKWVGIRVEQFAVGFGHAMFAWRKGIGFRLGNTQKDYREKAQDHLAKKGDQSVAEAGYTDAQIAAAADELGLGETEYRLNWIPLGGYVKMLGQDDLKPDAPADDPRAFARKSVSARMLVISAGVIMNVILAAIGFMVLFLIGFNAPPAWAGTILPGSPAQKAGLHVGDHILYFNGKWEADFTKIMLDTALVKEGVPVKMVVSRPDHPGDPNTKYHDVELTVTPERQAGDTKFLAIGFAPPRVLKGDKVDSSEPAVDESKLRDEAPADALLIMPGDVITSVNGTPVNQTDTVNGKQVKREDYAVLDEAMQASHGKPVTLTIQKAGGKAIETKTFQPHFDDPFNGEFNLAGLLPRVTIAFVGENSPVLGKLKPMDIIDAIHDTDPWPHPSHEQFMERVKDDGESGHAFELDVIRDGKLVKIPDIKATVKVAEHRKGLSVAPAMDETHTVLADVVKGSPAEQAGLKGGDTITSINGTPVSTWYQVQSILADLAIPKGATSATAKITYTRPGVEKPAKTEMKLDADQLADVRSVRYKNYLALAEFTKARKTSSPLQAAGWGITETRDFILQFYLTLRRMADRSISPSNMMGPVGIFIGGKAFAYKGIDWLLWFLSMISANLAVVNFLPIPVVDGGQFMFLIFEKIKGRPLSAKAMAIAQYAGLAFLAAVVLFVTYNDIFRYV